MADAYQNVISLHQRRLEATAYTIIHMTNNLSKIAGLYLEHMNDLVACMNRSCNFNMFNVYALWLLTIYFNSCCECFVDSSKKRKKIRAKVSRQSELLKTLVSVYNENVDRHANANIPRVSLLSCLRDSFPWRQMPSDETNGTNTSNVS